MKKVMAFLLALVLLMGTAAVAEDVQEIEFKPTLTDALDKTAAEWASTSTNRALLTWLLLIDITLENKIDSDTLATFVSNTSYVGREGAFLIVVGRLDDEGLIIYYAPLLNSAYYLEVEGVTSDSMVDMIANGTITANCSDGVYKNDVSDLISVGSQLTEIFSD